MQTPSLSPGYWQAAYYPDHDTYLVTSDGATIAEVTTEPDARAIAALPQMVDVLRRVASWSNDDQHCHITIAVAQFQHEARSALSAAGF